MTGGGGRLGRLVVDTLRRGGIRTTSLMRQAVARHADDVVADLTDAAAVSAALADRRIDAIIHLAAAIHRDDAVEVNARMDASLEAIIRKNSPRAVIFSSTAAVYGDASSEALTEESPTLGASPYALSKRSSEEALRSLTLETPALSVTVLRVFNIAGPDFPDSLVQRMLGANAADPVRLVRPDSFVRDYIHQADVVRVVQAALERAEAGHRVYNVGAGAPVTTRSLLESLRIAEDAWVEVEGNASISWCDNHALVRSLGVTPRAMPSRAWALADPG